MTRFWLVTCFFGVFMLTLVSLQTRYPVVDAEASIPAVTTHYITDVLPQIPELETVRYNDLTLGISANVPLGWSRRLLEDAEVSGIAVTYESPRTSPDDIYADYLMVEILPTTDDAGFQEFPSETIPMVVGEEMFFRQRIDLPDYSLGSTRVDLVAWQLQIQKEHYVIGIYAVGQLRESPRLERALIEYVRSFVLQRPPFKVA